MVVPFSEYLLWHNCQLSCKFCDERYEHQSSNRERIQSIRRIKEDILNFKSVHNILFIGGEIFANLTEELKKELLDLYKTAFNCKNVELVYTNTNLIYKPDFLLSLLSVCDVKRLKLATSWDIEGRFINNRMKEQWESNMKLLRKTYKDLCLVVNMILDKKLVSAINNNIIDIKKFEKKYKVLVNTIPYVDLNKLDDYKPSKDEVLKCFIKLYKQDKDWLYNYLTRLLLRYQLTLYDYNGATCTDSLMSCGHHSNFSNCFSNSNECFKCFCNAFLREFYRN